MRLDGPDAGHPTVTVTDSETGGSAEIDVGIAPLVETMWRAGIGTRWSCQDKDGRAWLVVPRLYLARLTEMLGSDLADEIEHQPYGTGATSLYFDPSLVPAMSARINKALRH